MREDFISYIWKNRRLQGTSLRAVTGETLEVLDPGQENNDSGPDFFAARIRIDGTLWIGNVEVHRRTSDWQKHGHQHDPAYDNIILHVVFENDQDVFTSNGKKVPVLEIKNLVDENLLENYRKLIENKNWIACENSIGAIDQFIINNWLSRLLVERLERKAEEVMHFYRFFANDWDQTFYYLLARNFGFKVNASSFALLAQRTPFALLAKNSDSFSVVEAMLFGQAGLLPAEPKDLYPRLLLKEYQYQRKKYQLEPLNRELWKFARLRPVNFPTLRIAQFAALIHRHGRLFSKAMKVMNMAEAEALFLVQASPYWDTHYSFDKPSAPKTKRLGTDAIHNLVINTIAPVQFVYATQHMDAGLKEKAIMLFQHCPAENNTIISRWRDLGIAPQNAADTQALLELKKYYCTPGKCLKCPIGHIILRK
jgi:hypothetical protein